jgi:hypothetical protein
MARDPYHRISAGAGLRILAIVRAPPEHLALMVASELSPRSRQHSGNAGAILMGDHAPPDGTTWRVQATPCRPAVAPRAFASAACRYLPEEVEFHLPYGAAHPLADAMIGASARAEGFDAHAQAVEARMEPCRR